MNAEELNALGVEPEQIDKGAYRIRLTSNSQSLSILSRLAKEYSIHPRIRSLVAELLAPCKEKDYDCYINRITSFVKENIKYVNDPPRAEVFQSPLRTLEWGIGDCDDFSVLTTSLLRAAGFEARPKIRKVNDRWGHVVVEVFHPTRKEWLEIDTTDKEGNDMEVYELGLIDPVESVEELPESDTDVAELGELMDAEGEFPETGEVAELGRGFTGRRWILAWRGHRLYRELWYYRHGRRVRLLRRYLFTGRRWIVRKVPTARHPGAPVIYYKELWYYRHGRPVRRLRRIRWKVVRPHYRAPHRVHRAPHRAHTEAGIFSKSTIPLLLGAGALIYLLKK